MWLPLITLIESKLNDLKVANVKERSYGSRVVELYYGENFEDNEERQFWPVNMKQMAIINITPPIYVYLYK